MKYIFLATVFIHLFFFSGCLSKKEIDITHKRDFPSWYTNPPKTTTEIFYAIGEAEDRDSAIADALNMMASTLSVYISSDYKSEKIVKEGEINSYQSNVSNEIKSSVKKIRISHYELLKSKELGFKKYIVLIKSDKQKLYESLKNELEQRFIILDKQKEMLHNKDAIKELAFYEEAKDMSVDAQNILIVLKGLNENFITDKYVEKINEINSAYDRTLNSISFSIDSDKNSKDLVTFITHGLNLKKFKVKEQKSKEHYYITLSSDIQRAFSYGFILAHFAIDITVKDYKGVIIGSNKLNITGQSTQSYKIAKESAAIKFKKRVKEQGIGKIIGLNITNH